MAVEWDWNARSPEFWKELIESDKDYVRKLDTIAWKFEDGVLSVDNIVNGIALTPMHANVRLLLETIKQLEPDSAADFGCGFGDILFNTSLLLPDAELYGYDIASSGLERVRERHPSLNKRAILWNCDIGVPVQLPPVELAYTSVVIMHILGPRRIVALRNIFETATRHVVLMENWLTHSFMDDIKWLYNEHALFGWDELYFYWRYSPEYDRPHLMVISKDDDLPYEKLTDYEVTMCEPLAKAKSEGRP